MFSLAFPVFAAELTQTTAWDAGYVKAEVILPTKTASYGAIGSYGGSCVSFVKASLGVTESWISPWYLWNSADLSSLHLIKTKNYQVNDIVITSEGEVWHMGIIITVGFEQKYDIITVRESNYISPGIISQRTLKSNNPIIRGYLRYIVN